ncbi:SPFH domain-containing protein [Candidatus Riflebacteria bacterium]
MDVQAVARRRAKSPKTILSRKKFFLIFMISLPMLLMLQGCVTPVVIGADEAGLKLNTITGNTSIIKSSGTFFQKWYIEKIYIIKRSEYNLEMTGDVNRGDARGRDDCRVKTFDGSDVYVDVSFTYRIVLDNILEVLRYTGYTDRYLRDLNIKDKWIRPYARCRIREEFGRLSTEQFYDARQRQVMAEKTMVRLNKDLNQHGIIITNVNIQDFRFYKKYEDKIREKKSADQSVEREKSKKRAALEEQKRQKVFEQKKVEVKIADFKGNLRQQFLLAEGKAREKVVQAEAYAYSRKKAGDAGFYRAKNEAKQILELGKAESNALKQQVNAMAGAGGKNLLRLEYARKMKNLEISGEPWLISPEISALRVKDLPNLSESSIAIRRRALKKRQLKQNPEITRGEAGNE